MSSIPDRPTALPVILDAIPAELQALDQWVMWRYEFRKGKWTKPPLTTQADPASSTDRSTWTTFEKVKAAYEASGFDGIGFINLPENNLTAGDWDYMFDPVTMQVKEYVVREVAALDTYTERSPGGDGLRAYAYGKKPGRDCVAPILDANRKTVGKFELYDGYTKKGVAGGRYLTLTGHRLPIAPTTIKKRQAQIELLYASYFGVKKKPKESPKGKAKEAKPAPETNGHTSGLKLKATWSPPPDRHLSDEEMDKLIAAGSDKKLTALFNGDTQSWHDGDDSRADAGFLQKSAWWMGGIFEDRLDRLLRASKLYREKWDRDDYRERTFAYVREKTLAFRELKQKAGGNGKPPPADWPPPAVVALRDYIRFLLKPAFTRGRHFYSDALARDVAVSELAPTSDILGVLAKLDDAPP